MFGADLIDGRSAAIAGVALRAARDNVLRSNFFMVNPQFKQQVLLF
jgi:hypothetical protein